MMLNRRVWVACTVSVASMACANATSPLAHQQCGNPDARLAAVLQPLEALRADGCAGAAVSDCDRLQREVERLVVICPGHVPTLMANAVLAYDDRRPAQSQQYLDEILSQPRTYPDAAALRARIAIEEGNLPYARRLLEQQIRLVPDHPGLHETYAAALYLDGRMPQAVDELSMAAALGAPAWRIAYHRGLIEEASGRLAEAGRYYSEALQGNPGWAPAESRLKALRARDGAARP
jgi:tetratricopeptide (TPR) repeat protein